MKHFIDIENLREEDIDLGDGIVRKKNCEMFVPGVQIHVSCKVDGSNASITYNTETDSLNIFSRKKELDYKNTLQGFWNFVQDHPWDMDYFKEHPNWTFFGEWLGAKHIVPYPQEMYKQWYVYDIWDEELERYLPSSFVEEFAKRNNLNYIETFYEGEFISWEHIKSFCHSSKYTDVQEGVVVRLNEEDAYTEPLRGNPPFLKIVNDEYKEISVKQHIQKMQDPQKIAEKQRSQELIESVVTSQRVKKEIHKMIDEGLLPSEITPQDMKIVAQNLPKRIYEDCLKEEPEIIQEAGEYSGKAISSLTMKIAKEIILGG